MSQPWWDAQTGIMLGSIGGSALGMLGGMFGAAIGVCAPRGIAKGPVVSGQVALVAVGVALAITGAVAALVRQPSTVYYPLMLGGGLLTSVLGALLPLTLTTYRIAEVRLRGHASGAADLNHELTGAATSAVMMRVIAECWGRTGRYRAWSTRGALLIALAAVTATVALSLSLSGQEMLFPRGQAMGWGMLAISLGMGAGMLGALTAMLGRRAAQCSRVLEEQRLAAEELRRGGSI